MKIKYTTVVKAEKNERKQLIRMSSTEWIRRNATKSMSMVPHQTTACACRVRGSRLQAANHMYHVCQQYKLNSLNKTL